LRLNVDLRQCWFPEFHADIGGGGDMDDHFVDDNGAPRTIEQISLAWMCDHIEGLVTFREDDHEVNAKPPQDAPKDNTKPHLKRQGTYAFLNAKDDNWTWGARRQVEPISVMYATDLGGGSVYRTLSQYNRTDLDIPAGKLPSKEDLEKMSLEYTRERIHPSVRLLINATEKYKPAALGYGPIMRYAGYDKYMYLSDIEIRPK